MLGTVSMARNLQEMLGQLDLSRAAARQMAYGAAVQMLAGRENPNSLDLIHSFSAISDGVFAKIMDDANKDAVLDREQENGTQE